METSDSVPTAKSDEISHDVDEIQKYFDVYDTDASGTIDRSELQNLALDLGQEFDEAELNEAFEALDKNGDGKISFLEFKKWWTGA